MEVYICVSCYVVIEMCFSFSYYEFLIVKFDFRFNSYSDVFNWILYSYVIENNYVVNGVFFCENYLLLIGSECLIEEIVFWKFLKDKFIIEVEMIFDVSF